MTATEPVYYTLDADGRPVEEPDFGAWAAWCEATDRLVALDDLPGGHQVATAFVGLAAPQDLARHDCELPRLWSTTVTAGPHNGWSRRYRSRLEAAAGHVAARAWLAGKGPEPALGE